MDKITTTVDVDENGRLTLPKPVRRSLGIDGDEATVEIDVGVVE